MRIDIEITPRAKRAIAWFLLPLVVLVGTIAVAHAVGMNPIVTSWIPTAAQNHTGISSSLLKGNLDDLQAQATALDARLSALETGRNQETAGGAYSVGAVMKTVTAPVSGKITTPSGLVGFLAAKALCVGAAGSPTAHMCDAAEVVRSAQLGIPVPGNTQGQVWIATGVFSQPPTSPTTYIMDCFAFTQASTSVAGNTWDGQQSAGYPCDGPPLPIACCD